MRRSLIHFWPIHLAVIAGAAVATAVLIGALVVGDSIQASLRDLTLERLGRVDRAVTGERLFAAALADRLDGDGGEAAVPVLALRGAAVAAAGGARAARVGIWGIDERFAGLFPGDEAAAGLDLARRSGQIFPSLAINAALARELAAAPGDEVLLQFERRGEVPRATLLGDSDPTAGLRSLRLTVTAVLPDRGAGRFSLAANQTLPLNAFVELGCSAAPAGAPRRGERRAADGRRRRSPRGLGNRGGRAGRRAAADPGARGRRPEADTGRCLADPREPRVRAAPTGGPGGARAGRRAGARGAADPHLSGQPAGDGRPAAALLHRRRPAPAGARGAGRMAARGDRRAARRLARAAADRAESLGGRRARRRSGRPAADDLLRGRRQRRAGHRRGRVPGRRCSADERARRRSPADPGFPRHRGRRADLRLGPAVPGRPEPACGRPTRSTGTAGGARRRRSCRYRPARSSGAAALAR